MAPHRTHTPALRLGYLVAEMPRLGTGRDLGLNGALDYFRDPPGDWHRSWNGAAFSLIRRNGGSSNLFISEPRHGV